MYLLIQDLFFDHWRYKLSLDSSTAQADDGMVENKTDSHFSLELAILTGRGEKKKKKRYFRQPFCKGKEGKVVQLYQPKLQEFSF